MEQPVEVVQQKAPVASSDTDGRVLLFFFLPLLAISGAIYLGGGKELALYIAGAAFVISAFAAPEIGLYAYMAIQAIDLMAIQEKGSILTPGKIIGPFILLTYLVHPGRVRAPMVIGRPIVICGLLFGLTGILAASWSYFPINSLRGGAQVLVQALLLGVALHRLTDRKRIGRAMIATFLGSALAAGLLLTGRGEGSQGPRATLGESYDANSLAMAVEFGIFAVVALWFCVRSLPIRLAALAVCPIMAMSVVLTGSRTALVLAVAVPIGAMLTVRGFQAHRFILPVIVAVILVLGLRYGLKSLRLSAQTEERLSELVEGRLDVRGESRIRIALGALEEWTKQPWGFGFICIAEHMGMQGKAAMTVHDNYLSVLIEGGPIAFGMILAVYILTFRSIRAAGNSNLALPAMMFFMTVAISSLAFNSFTSKFFWIPLTLAVLLAEQAHREQREAAPQPRRALTRDDLLRNLGPQDVVVYGAPT